MKVLDFAIEVEKAERDFFRRLAEKVESRGLKTIYSRIAEDEENLLKKFEDLKSSGKPAEESRILDALLEKVRNHLDSEKAPKVEDEVAAYRYLVEVEKGVCSLFQEAAESEKDEQVRRRLAQVAGEECRESEEVESVYDFTNAPNEFLAWGEFSNLDEFYNFGRYAGRMQILPEKEVLA